MRFTRSQSTICSCTYTQHVSFKYIQIRHWFWVFITYLVEACFKCITISVSYECRFFSNRFSVNVNFRVLLKGLNGSSKADYLSFCRSRHDTEESFAAQPLLLSFHGPQPTDFLGPRYIFPRIFPIPCLALIRSKITKLPAGTSGRLSAILPLCSVVFFKKLTTDDRSDDNVFKSLDQPLVFKSILQILQKSLGTM